MFKIAFGVLLGLLMYQALESILTIGLAALLILGQG